MTDSINSSVCFTGHRTINPKKLQAVKEKLYYTIMELYNEGHRTFLCGMAIGFDLLAAEILIELKETYKDIIIVACIPFIGQESRFSPTDQERYNKVINSVDSKVIIARTFSKQSYLLRNIYMLEHSSIVVAYFDTNIKKGGTFFTYNKAIMMGKEVRNIF